MTWRDTVLHNASGSTAALLADAPLAGYLAALVRLFVVEGVPRPGGRIWSREHERGALNGSTRRTRR